MLLTNPNLASLKIDSTTDAEALVNTYMSFHGEGSPQHVLAQRVLKKVRVLNRDVHNLATYQNRIEVLKEHATCAYRALNRLDMV